MDTDILSRLNGNGTGLNLRELATSLVKAETDQRRAVQQARIDTDVLRLAALDKLRTQLGALGGALASAAAEPVLAVETTTASILPAVTDRSRLQTGTVALDVVALAQRQVLEFTGFTDAAAALETGTLTLEFGQWSTGSTSFTADAARSPVTLTITAGMTLQDLAEALTEVTGVTARVLTKGDGTFSLGVVTETGALNGLRLTAAGDGGGGATLLAGFDTTTTNATRQVQAATDARVVVDGILITRTTNVLEDVLPGMSITVSAVTAGTITVGRDAAVAEKGVKALIEGLNATLVLMRNLTDRGANGRVRGDLAGDSNIQGLENALRRVISAPIRGYADRPVYLADLGIGTQRDGTLFFDPAVFDRAVAAGARDFDAALGDSLQSLTEGVTVGGLPSRALAAGDYDFAIGPGGEATLNGVAMVGVDNGDGTFSYTALEGDVAGLTVTVDTGVTEATIRFGRSFVAEMAALLDSAGLGGALRRVERDIAQSSEMATERLAAIEARAAVLERRYMGRFTQMEQMVTQLNNTGSFLTNLIDQWNKDR
jgi:flagellar hook-associated protein 2